MTPTRLADIKTEFAALSEIGEVDFDMGMSSALKLIGELVAEVQRLRFCHDRLWRFATQDPSKIADEAEALNGSMVKEEVQAIDVANRAAALKQRNQQLREATAERDAARADVEQLQAEVERLQPMAPMGCVCPLCGRTH